MSNLLLQQFRKMPKPKGVSSGCWLTLYYLCDLANKDTNIAYPSVATIGREIGLSAKQARRNTHFLIHKDYLKIVENSLGGEKGKSCRYKIFLPDTEQKASVDNFSTTPLRDPHHSHERASTTPIKGSQTVVKPYTTYKAINNKFGFDWQKNPDTAYRVGLELGVHAYPGEDTFTFVGRIYSKLNTEQVRLER